MNHIINKEVNMAFPVIFTGQGSPMIALENNELTKNFNEIGDNNGII